MKTFEVIVSKRVRFKTIVKAENEEQGKAIAQSNDSNLDYEDIMRILIAFKDKHNKDLAKLDKKYEGLRK